MAESGPNASDRRLGRDVGPGHGRRAAAVAGPDPAASAGTGESKKSHRHLLQHADARSRYEVIATQREPYPVRRLCQVPGVPASGYSAGQQGQQRAVGSESPAWETALVKAFRHHKRRYGTRRLRVALRSPRRRGDCYDNAPAESLWSRLQTEVLELREWPVFADLADAQASVADYFDYDNHDRLPASLDYRTPYHTPQQLLPTTALNWPA